ncbi:hypothetical protein UlMin_004235 [Ulmus minor]
MVLLVAAPGNGKSTFCEEVMRLSTRSWVRICQDDIGNGKAGTKARCLTSAASALNEGKSVFIDRCNLDREQCAEFVKLGSSKADAHAVMLDLPAKLCISLSVKRSGHEGNLQGGKAAAVVNRRLQKKELPKLSKGFTRITFCQHESDVQDALNAYSALGPLDTFPEGTFGQKSPDAKVQVGGGVHAAIFAAAGPALEVATKERAKSLFPGSAVVVPLPSTCPLFCKEGVTHVIHVLGPNMNPQRPNCVNNDYVGCKILCDTCTSLFEGFASIVRTQAKFSKSDTENIGSKQSESQGHCEDAPRNSEQKIKRDTVHESDRGKKCKGSHPTGGVIPDSGAVKTNKSDEKFEGSTTKAWGSWAQALYHTAMQPEKHKDTVLEVSDDVVVIYDVYPKAWKHLLFLARHKGLDRLADICKEHLQLLKTMHAVELKWADKLFKEDAWMIFRLGYHSVPSTRQLHLHLISQDFDSKRLKNKKHWDSFIFRDSVDIIEEVSSHGKARLEEDEKLLSAHPNIPCLKSHISNCQAPFPANHLQNGR